MSLPFERALMRTLLTHAERQKGKTSPNPVTASAIVRDERVIAWGIHQGPGHPHAEVEAIQKAGALAKGSSLYVNLEPCSHSEKRTPPCTKAIIEAGISEVIYAVEDPNPLVRAEPAKQSLEKAGIRVRAGVEAQRASQVNEIFFKNQIATLPFVTLKAGISLDGKIALSNLESKYITGEKSLKQDHKLRREHDAMLIGVGTILADNPSLNVRFGLLKPGYKNPIKLILDAKGNIPLTAKVFQENRDTRVIVIVSDALVNSKKILALQAVAEVWFLPEVQGHFDWKVLLKKAFLENIFSILIEGGRGIYTSALEARIVDKFHFFIAPKILGGAADIGVFAGKSHAQLTDILTLSDLSIKPLGEDIWVSGYPPSQS